ncbi:MAG: hydrogenase, partial [Bacillota bacterium]
MANLVWLHGGACNGNTQSFLNAEEPTVVDLVTDFGIRILYHHSISMEFGEEARRVLEAVLREEIPLDILVFEGTVIQGPNGTG